MLRKRTPSPQYVPHTVTFWSYHRELLRLAMADSLERHGSIRDAASEIGMPRATFHDLARELGIDTRANRKRAR